MVNSFSKYLNNIRAEDSLKANTKDYIRAALAVKSSQQADTDSVAALVKTKFKSKRLLVTVSSVAACAILAIGGYAFYNTPANYVSIDINPSVEFGLNAFDKVVSAQAYNEDGTLILEANRYTHQSLEKAISVLIQEAAEQGFIMEDGSTVIAITPASNNDDTATELQYSCENGVNLALNAGEMSAIIYSDCIDLPLRTQAMEAGVSPGKYRLIEILQSLDASITVEQYKNMKVTEIITKANELFMLSENSGGTNGIYESAFERIQNAAQQVKAAYENTEQEQNQGSGNGTGQQKPDQGHNSPEQEQNQNSGAPGNEQEQEQNQNQPDGSPSETESAGQNEPGDGQPGADLDSGGAGSSTDNSENPSGEQRGK